MSGRLCFYIITHNGFKVFKVIKDIKDAFSHRRFVEENRRFVEIISYIRYMFLFLPTYIDI